MDIPFLLFVIGSLINRNKLFNIDTNRDSNPIGDCCLYLRFRGSFLYQLNIKSALLQQTYSLQLDNNVLH